MAGVIPFGGFDQETVKKAYDEILEDCHHFNIATEYHDLPSWVAGEGAKGVAEEIMTGWGTEGSIQDNPIHQLLDYNMHLDDEDLFDLLVETVKQHAERLEQKPSLDTKIRSVAHYAESKAVRDAVLESDRLRNLTLDACYKIPGYEMLPREDRNKLYDLVKKAVSLSLNKGPVAKMPDPQQFR